KGSMEPDASHLHSLIYRALAARARDSASPAAAPSLNARVAPRLWLHQAICLTAALVLIEHTHALLVFIGVYAIFYVASYRALARRRAMRIGTPFSGPHTRSENGP